ncbi:MAG: hypothetical protein ABIH99_00790 [Candidatus Micrarchaeota archaeon]
MSGRNPGLAQQVGHYRDASSFKIRETQGRHFQPRNLKDEGRTGAKKPFTSLKNTITNVSSAKIIPKYVEPVLVFAKPVKVEKKEARAPWQDVQPPEEAGNIRKMASWPITKIFLVITTVAFAFVSWACATTGLSTGAQKPAVSSSAEGAAKAESKEEFGFVKGKTTVEEAKKILAEKGYAVKEKKALVDGTEDRLQIIYADNLPIIVGFKNNTYFNQFELNLLSPTVDTTKSSGLETLHINTISPGTVGFFVIANDWEQIYFIGSKSQSDVELSSWRLTDILEPCDKVNGKVVIKNPMLEAFDDGSGFFLWQEGWRYLYAWGLDGKFGGIIKVEPEEPKQPALSSRDVSLKQD